MIESVLNILSKDFIPRANESEIEEICGKAWNLVMETKNDAPLSIAVSFMKLAFNNNTICLRSTPILFDKVLEIGNIRWGITRTLLYECIPLWIKNPQAITGYVNSIYQLTIYEESRSEDTDFLIPCIFALINCPKPHIQGDPSTLRSQYIRILMLYMIEKVTSNTEFITMLLEKCCKELYDACQDRGEFPNSFIYKKKIRLGQLLCCLCPWIRDHSDEIICKEVANKLSELLKIPYVHSARPYIERVLIIILLKSPAFTNFIELDYDMKPQLAGSYLLILGSVMVFTTDESIRLKIFNDLLPFMISNTAHIRRVAHFVMFKLLQNYPEYRSKSIIFEFLIKNKECAKMMQRLESILMSFDSFKECNLDFILTGHFSEFDEILHSSLVSEIDEKTKNLLDTSYEINFSDI